MRSPRDVFGEKGKKRFHRMVPFVSRRCIRRDEQTAGGKHVGGYLAVELGVALEKGAFKAESRGIARLGLLPAVPRAKHKCTYERLDRSDGELPRQRNSCAGGWTFVQHALRCAPWIRPGKPSPDSGALTVPVTMTVYGMSFSIGAFEYLATPIKHPLPPFHGTAARRLGR